MTTGRVTLALALFFTPAVAGAGDDNDRVKPPYGAKVDQKLPLLVVDFNTGAHKKHCGCVSVMLRNQKARGVVIVARGEDEQAVQLARTLDEFLPEGKDKPRQGYLALFDKVSADLLDKAALTKVNAGHARDSQEKWFRWVGLAPMTDSAVFFIGEDKIQAVWELPRDGLNETKRAEIVAKAKSWFEGAK